MKPILPALAVFAAFALSACGYKGNLYLPKEGDKARFGVIQTGLQTDFSNPKVQSTQTED